MRVASLLLLQDQGLALHLRKAALHWSCDAPTSTLWSSLLLHDLGLAAGELLVLLNWRGCAPPPLNSCTVHLQPDMQG